LAEPGDVWGGGCSDKEEAEEITYCTSRRDVQKECLPNERDF